MLYFWVYLELYFNFIIFSEYVNNRTEAKDTGYVEISQRKT